ncbi:hemerythrin domain-containing protein [Streptomyces sp. NPDC087218]|uniref:hemerythrin domain-containing protein n=1 Tax=Streptomyces sp. NPDC087218 TaxID=3365769 RepID=UPI0037F150F8
MKQPEGDVLHELAADHRELEAVFWEIELQPVDHPTRGELVDRLIAELVRHTVVEEAYLHPAMRECLPHGQAMADKELADHAKGERLLRRLEGLSVGDPDFNDTLARLKFAVAFHVREEEHDLFPKLAAALPPEKLAELGRLVRLARPRPAARRAVSSSSEKRWRRQDAAADRGHDQSP